MFFYNKALRSRNGPAGVGCPGLRGDHQDFGCTGLGLTLLVKCPWRSVQAFPNPMYFSDLAVSTG